MAIYNSNGSQSDVMAKLALATTSGDIVTIPTGSYTWGAGFVAVNLEVAGVSLVGAGTGLTTIALDPSGPNGNYGTIQFLANATVSGFTINGSAVNSVNPFGAYVGGTINDIRITNINYNPLGSNAYFLIGQEVGGVIDNCSIFGGAGNAELIFIRGPLNAWTQPNSFGNRDALFIENNIFGGFGYVTDINSNAKAVVRYNTIVSPGVKIDAHGMDSNSPARSFRSIEVYGNRFTNGGGEAIAIRGASSFIFNNEVVNTSPEQTWLELINYGCAGVWPNYGVTSITASAANPTVITTSIPHGYQTNWYVYVNVTGSNPTIAGFYSGTVLNSTQFTIPVNVTIPAGPSGQNFTARQRTPYDYPSYDQVGRGRQINGTTYNDSSCPTYLWNNTSSGGLDWELKWKGVDESAVILYRNQTGNFTTGFTMQDMIAANRDYFKGTVGAVFDGTSGVGVGTKAQMNAITPTKTGVGFWVTDEGSWNKTVPINTAGQFYTWSGNWNLTYTPYQYPYYYVTSSGSSGPNYVYKRLGRNPRFKVLVST